MAKNKQKSKGRQVQAGSLKTTWKIILVIAIIVIVGLGIYYSAQITGNATKAVKPITSVSRTVLSSCKLDQSCKIRLTIKAKNVEDLAIEEKIPAGWTYVSSSSEASITNTEKGKVAWIFGGPLGKALGKPRNIVITYVVKPTTKTGSFSGTWGNENGQGTISGKSSVKVK